MFLLNFLTRETSSATRTMKLSEAAAADSWWRLHADEADWLTERWKDSSVVTRLLLVPVRAATGLTGGNAPTDTEEHPVAAKQSVVITLHFLQHILIKRVFLAQSWSVCCFSLNVTIKCCLMFNAFMYKHRWKHYNVRLNSIEWNCFNWTLSA